MTKHHPACEHPELEIGSDGCICVVADKQALAHHEAWALRIEDAMCNTRAMIEDVLQCEDCKLCKSGVEQFKRAIQMMHDALFSLFTEEDKECYQLNDHACVLSAAIIWARTGCGYWDGECCTAEGEGVACVMHRPCSLVATMPDDPDERLP